MDAAQFQRLMPAAPAGAFAAIAAALAEFNFISPLSQCMILANVAQETNQLRTLEENLNYSAGGLAATFSFCRNADGTPTDHAKHIARDPVAIGNYVYADRMGNGPEASGDGWRHRGSGGLMLTGKTNHAQCGIQFHITDVGPWLRTLDGAARSAAWFARRAGLETFANARDFDGACDAINVGHKTPRIGDANGYPVRLQYYRQACAIMGV